MASFFRVLAATTLVAGTLLLDLVAPPGVGAQDEPSGPSVPCDPDLLGPLCPSAEALAITVASLCEEVGAPLPVCTLADPDVADPAAVDAFEESWVNTALRLQHHLDDHVPLVEALVPHTHNSYNSTVYPLALSNLDPNQRYSVVDQLRLGMRGIELDLHWVNGAVVLCHGQAVQLGPEAVHVGCSLDRPFGEGLAELRVWLMAPGNEAEFLVLYLENQLDGDSAAHAQAVSALESHLGSLVIKPPSDAPCAPMPLDSSESELTEAGGRVLIVGNCGPGGWGAWVHERGDRWDERSNGDGYDDYPGCAADRDGLNYPANWIRIYEDSTWLSATAGTGSEVTAAETRAMVRCGVNMPGFDRLTPTDPRIGALIWSWAPDNPTGTDGHACAYRGADGRFYSSVCDEHRAFACQGPDGTWLISEVTGPVTAGRDACQALGAQFAVPPNGWENELLGIAAAAMPTDRGEPWLAYASMDGQWSPGTVPLDTTPSSAAAPRADPTQSSAALPTEDAAAPGALVVLPRTGPSFPYAFAAALMLAVLAIIVRQLGSGGRRHDPTLG